MIWLMMGDSMEFTTLTTAEYAEFEKQSPLGSMTQSVEQYDLLQGRGKNVHILGVKDIDGTIVAGSIVTFDHINGGTVAAVNHGPLMNYNDTATLDAYLQGLAKFAKQFNGLYIKFSPNVVYRRYDNHGNPLTEPADDFIRLLEKHGAKHMPFKKGMSTDGSMPWQYSKDLRSLDLDTLVASYQPDVKYYLKKNTQFGVKFRELPFEELDKFKKLTADTAERRGFDDKELSFYEVLFNTYGTDAHFTVAEVDFPNYLAQEQATIDQLDTKINTLAERLAVKETKKNRGQFNEFTDQKNMHIKRIKHVNELFGGEIPTEPTIVAGALFVEQPQEMAYMFSGMYDEYREYFAPYLIQDTMMRMAIEHNIPTHNFYGISGEFDGSDGVFRFKTEFNGTADQLVGEFEYPINKPKYFLYKLMKKLLGRA